ncbi:CoA-disulfide reductase [Candidatus Epulonipiscium viviparus]|uniref:CoA-disulfide reductase n=1 Tax=Candidatus Epulonipiscium viviparus TaxID=420336 RepID=UPI00049509CF|nr:CoA-disulfide reductase [Candidatus Epulopiscium viviparus]
MKIVIIGGIAAGMSAAAKFRRLDKESEVVVYEKSSYVSFGACGLPYFVGDFFKNEEEMIVRTPQKYREAGIDVKERHEVLSVNTAKKTLQVKNLYTLEVFEDSYDKLVIATGATTIMPKIALIEHAYTLRTLSEGRVLRKKIREAKHVTIIGAGFIGLEVADAAKHLGKDVEVFQLEERVLTESFDKEITDILERELRSKGVKIHTNTAVEAILARGARIASVRTTENDTINTDIVVIATGVKPATQFLANSGIKMAKNGAIIVDKQGKTSAADVYAAGDCATIPHKLKEEAYIPLATGANKLGRVIGENLAGQDVEFAGTLGSSCLKVLDMEIAKTGLNEREAKELGINYAAVLVADKDHTSYYPGQSDIHVKLIYNKDTKAILGGQIIGKSGVVGRVNALAVAIYAGLTPSDLGMMDFCYAPPFARTWDVLNIVGNVVK